MSIFGEQLPIFLVGAACRLPGAVDEKSFRALLSEGRCSIQPGPIGRWNIARSFHSSPTEPGFSYSFAGGYLDNPFAFDPTVFGVSPREAAQMDPQQRLLLEVVYEAVEDARLPWTDLTGHDVGVYVGASSLDYGSLHAADPASIDSYFMTGNTLSVVANRLSYVFDWRGPSFTVDTACSSSLVAFAQAVSDLRSGRVDTAVVAGVNILLSPASFVGFSRASMLSPTGLCRPFSAAGDGYVRSEGGVAFVLRRADVARPGTARAEVLAAGVNSDGRTSGIALPNLDGQIALLERVYGELGLHPNELAFVEAHGTGTRVGDPIEATALGRVLGKWRTTPLPIGSVKSNIGHLEPASGAAGVMKALISLEQRRFPANLHLDELNPLIDFAALNLAPAVSVVELDPSAPRLSCGVSSFGFGGTNAHVVLRSLPAPAPVAAPVVDQLILSAASREALRGTAARHAALLAEGAEPDRLAAALHHDRARLKYRIVAPFGRGDDLSTALAAFAEGGRSERLEEGTAVGRDAKVCFVYSGNGAQWVGMGRSALAHNAVFRRRFEEIETVFAGLAGRSLIADLKADDFTERMRSGVFVQPLFFAIQAALTAALEDAGLVPEVVVGHSLGEVAAAFAADAIDLNDALRTILARSTCQESLRGQGGMAVFAATRDAVEQLVADLGRDDVTVVAENGPNSVTISGKAEGVRLVASTGRRRRMANRILDVEYPYHTRYIDHLRGDMLATLGEVGGRPGRIPLVSTVSGDVVAGSELDAEHWWRNMREPVAFRRAVVQAANLGADLFVEIGPRPILVSPISETLSEQGVHARVVASLTESDDNPGQGDPVARIVARAVAHGAKLIGESTTPPADRRLELPTYSWNHSDLRFKTTPERLDVFGDTPRHPLIGARLLEAQPEWRTLLDARIVPYLADHVVDGEVVVPGAALVEMILAAGRDLNPEGAIGVEDLDVLTPIVLPLGAMREISVRHDGLGGFVEIWGRPRLEHRDWSLHARGRLLPSPGHTLPVPPPSGPLRHHTAEEIYARAQTLGLEYGPSFRLIVDAVRDDKTMDVHLTKPDLSGVGVFDRPQCIDPTSLDAALHALFCLAKIDPLVRRAHLPVRFGRVALHRDGASVASARLHVERECRDTLTVSIWLFDEEGEIVAEVNELLLRAVTLSRVDSQDVFFHLEQVALNRTAALDVAALVKEALVNAGADEVSESSLLLRAYTNSVAHRELSALADETGLFDPSALIVTGKMALEASRYAVNLAENLVETGLARRAGDSYRLAPETGLPEPEPILRTFAAEYPEASAELVLAVSTAKYLSAFLTRGTPIVHRGAVLMQFESDGRFGRRARQCLAGVLDRLVAESGDIRPRIICAEPDHLALLSELLPRVRRREIDVAVAGTDRGHLDRCAAQLPSGFDIHILDLNDPTKAGRRFDLALLHLFRRGDEEDLPERLISRLADGGAIVVIEPPVDPFFDFVLGAQDGWFEGSVDPAIPVGRVPPPGSGRSRLVAAGAVDIETMSFGSAAGAFVLGRAPSVAVEATVGPVGMDIAILGTDDKDAATALVGALRTAEGRITPADATMDGASPLAVVRIVPHGHGEDRLRLERAIRSLRETLTKSIGLDPRPTITVVVGSGDGATADPVSEAMRDFVRVAINEFSDLDLRLVDLDPSLAPDVAAIRLLARIRANDNEREATITARGTLVPRVRRGLPFASDSLVEPAAMELDFPRRGMLERFSWKPKDRESPEAGEIEVAVIATGLNFRDVMLVLGLLDDDVLDEGMAGSVCGFECAGSVVGVGPDVTDFAVGDIVFGFAARAFATHVTAAASGFRRIPPGMAPEVAAGLPVAFITAWYGLVELARLRKGERVLVHGAAGGVGLAAIQIARAKGARVFATVSTPDKRALVELMGAEQVFDSRSLSFAESIRSKLGGVDVVLNSLSGDAMRASLKCLRPFGRFVELGKRDYVGNTELALRPFRRNLTYFGVDLDQLLVHNPGIIAYGLRDLVDGFSEGLYIPLPIRLFGAAEVGAAFRLMQASGHVGKILLRPPALEGRRFPPKQPTLFEFGDGVELVVGGTGGFGFATAEHLAARGAKRIVVASRRGRLDADRAERLAAHRASGVDMRVEVCDVTDPASVEALVARIVATMGPISGVWLTAMVLEDGLIANMDDAALSRVLAPKVDGAANLDRATRGQPIERFVLFSSATTLVGNPGQGAYVAANGWMQGFARRRHAEGLPATSIAWGAISDVGALARDEAMAGRLTRLTGVAGLKAIEALHHLDDILSRDTHLADPVVYCSRFQMSEAMRDLLILRTPAFERVFGGSGDEGITVETDLTGLVAGKSDPEALRLLGELIAAEVAQIVRMPVTAIDLSRPLGELGIDSLMALELRMNVETKFGFELPLVAITSVRSLHDLTRRMLETLRTAAYPDPSGLSVADEALVAIHGGDQDAFVGLANEIEALRTASEVAQ